jgi:aspartyl-tRNA(Asn)/glutamyl-tRNA(Gln) amidotransferase subunit C
LSLTPEQVRHIAHLARLGIEDGEVDRFAGQLSEILDYFERLRGVDTEGIPPTAHTLLLHNVFRDDLPEPSLPPEQTLANAPQREDDYFRVRVVLEE